MSLTVIYGVTSSTEKLCNSYDFTDNVVFATTNGGESFKNQKSISLKELKHLVHKISSVIICAEAVTQILTSLQTIGVSIDKCSFYNHSRDSITPCNEIISQQIHKSSILYAIYDMSINLPCFDVVTFAILAESQRKRRNLEHICFIILPNRACKEEFIGVNQFHEKDDYTWRVNHIIKPVLQAIPSCLSIMELPYREMLSSIVSNEHNAFPVEALHNAVKVKSSTIELKELINRGEDIAYLSPPQGAISLVQKFISFHARGRKVISVTLREYQEQIMRNNNPEIWSKFLSDLDDNEFFPVIVRDSYYSTTPPPEGLENFKTFPEASADFLVRLALYSESYINLGVSTGPTYAISFLKGARSIIFHPLDESNPATSSLTAQKAGLDIGSDYFFNGNSYQKTIWEKESYEALTQSFHKLIQQINFSKGIESE